MAQSPTARSIRRFSFIAKTSGARAKQQAQCARTGLAWAFPAITGMLFDAMFDTQFDSFVGTLFFQSHARLRFRRLNPPPF
jgi:hypothetical protein